MLFATCNDINIPYKNEIFAAGVNVNDYYKRTGPKNRC
jgi:hypothetical protein